MDESLNECSYRIHPGSFKPIKLTLDQSDQGMVQKLSNSMILRAIFEPIK